MNLILTAILLFCDVFTMIIFLDVVLSWLTVTWIKFRPTFIADLLDPLYDGIQKYIPTTFWPFMFTPIILLFGIYLIRGLVLAADPRIEWYYQTLLSIY